ncbi:hypothetical protein DM01DRAFT_1339093 [Hesseltinella vesiculosa]|uniref:Uncharacterized protein n=1 Tax=Hesseltinella vesiculosa TaxID=101127 RepID=A0A1X2G826_9FUNG|nr:hypothetical protein DM01DRAFT_1339093 [Hesseltinella vesiculosa]
MSTVTVNHTSLQQQPSVLTNILPPSHTPQPVASHAINDLVTSQIRTQDQAREFFRQKQQQQFLQQQQLKQQSAQGSPYPTPRPNDPAISPNPDSRTIGYGIGRLMQLMDLFSPNEKMALDRGYWQSKMNEVFAVDGYIKWSLSNIEKNEQQSFYLSHNALVTFLYTLYQCGLVSLQSCLEQAVETVAAGHLDVDCSKCAFIYRYHNGAMTLASGSLACRFVFADGACKIQHLIFQCHRHELFLAYRSLKDEASIQAINFNGWGIPLRAYHVLQLSDVAMNLEDIIVYSAANGLSGRESLHTIASKIQPSGQPPPTPTQKHKASPKLPEGSESPAAKKKKITKRQGRRKSTKTSVKSEKFDPPFPEPSKPATFPFMTPTSNPTSTNSANSDFYTVDPMTPMATPTPYTMLPSHMAMAISSNPQLVPNAQLYASPFNAADLDEFMMPSVNPAITK